MDEENTRFMNIMMNFNVTLRINELYSRNLLSDKKYAYNVVAMKIKDGIIRQRDQNFTHIFPWKVVTPAPAYDNPNRFLYETFV